MSAFVMNGFRLFFIQIGYLKTRIVIFMLLRCYMCGFNCLSLFKCTLLLGTNA